MSLILARLGGWRAVLAAVLTLPAAFAQADLLIENANIYTMDPARPHANSLAVKGVRIASVGENLARFAGPGTKRIDAHGATIVPGLIDSHGHMLGLGDLLENLDFRGLNSIEGIAAMVKAAAAKAPVGEWIRGRNWDQTNWGGAFPTAAQLDAAAPGRPVYLTRVDGHAGWANSKALELAGIARDTPDPPGGKILRDARGNATGVLVDRAQGLVSAKIPPATPEQVKRKLARATAECARLGLTTVHDAGIDAATLAAYRELLAEGRLPVRVYAMIGGEGALWREYLAKGPEIGERLTVRSIKLVADGAMGSRGAAFWQPYSDDPGNTGLLILKREDIERVARAAVAHGFQVNTHAIGDRANRTTLDAYAAVLGGANDKRFRIEHAQVVSPPDFELFQRCSVIASMESAHATSDMRWAAARLGPDRLNGAWAQKKFLQLGVPLANGSDFPVEDPNPLWGFFAAVARTDREGNPKGGWMPEQKLTRQEALASWTTGGAYAAFEETQKGRLAPGMLADFVLLDRDIMKVPEMEIWPAKATMTVVGGEPVR